MSQILNDTLEIAQIAGDYILKAAKTDFKIESKKTSNDLVTEVDKATEELIIAEIKKRYPDHGILGEESSFANPENLEELAESKYIWIVDPIDGTTNFSHGMPYYSVSIGVFKTQQTESSINFKYLEGELIAGVVHAPVLKETFAAAKGEGATLNGEKITVSQVTRIQKALTVTGFSYRRKEQNLPYLHAMVKHAQGVRRLGSAALDLCYIAAGRMDVSWEFGLQPWDIAAGSLILKEAGGKLTDINGHPPDLFGKNIIASNGFLHSEVVDIFRGLGEG